LQEVSEFFPGVSLNFSKMKHPNETFETRFRMAGREVIYLSSSYIPVARVITKAVQLSSAGHPLKEGIRFETIAAFHPLQGCRAG
jgi:hypothetical protein